MICFSQKGITWTVRRTSLEFRTYGAQMELALDSPLKMAASVVLALVENVSVWAVARG